jgi:DNA-binding CsgD family transcriptional regulator
VVAGKDLSRLGTHVLSGLIEAAVRAGDLETALAAFERLTVRAEAADSLWSRGLLARSRALLAPDDAAEALFTEAEDHLAEAGMAADEARAYLLHGEWLRRRRRRTDAIAPLSRALEMFSAMDVPAFADRASIEIQAALASPRAQTAGRLSGLTPQERQVAQMAAQGATNREIAAARYISESTVAYHLQKIYRKLDITSRRQLTRLLAGQAADSCSASSPEGAADPAGGSRIHSG